MNEFKTDFLNLNKIYTKEELTQKKYKSKLEKFKHQRITEGISDYDLYDFDIYFLNFFINALMRFKEINIAYPGNEKFPTPESWDIYIDKIITGLLAAKDYFDNTDNPDYSAAEKQKCYEFCKEELKNSMNLFIDEFGAFWI